MAGVQVSLFCEDLKKLPRVAKGRARRTSKNYNIRTSNMSLARQKETFDKKHLELVASAQPQKKKMFDPFPGSP